MPKGKGPQGKRITLKVAKNAVRVLFNGRRRLELGKMGIATFPKCILELADVEELDLSRNLLRKIPNTIEKFQNLMWLDLHSNQIDELPAAIGTLQNLTFLNLCNNKLTTKGLPQELTLLRNLRTLNLGLNCLETIPTTLGSLRELIELGLFDNSLTIIPKSVKKLPKLERLNVKRNPLPEFAEEEKPIDTVKRIESLYLIEKKDLCGSCLETCQGERDELHKLEDMAPGPSDKPSFPSLSTPNSTARDNQEEWRIKEEDDNDNPGNIPGNSADHVP
ncbi:leucine-rich repeat-containing protein 18 [Poecile atricapillus]|uniref:leucine-rich repeat-containing protein 18 n=1 Tax=Pseudopodoces humilis TaxID=181119 RepID=UPI000395967A|nr:PREDICTED: leucine-rich repeat-containing protein 18 [Pseudopodoces humilis]XP_058697892.1 leucine-rich repeat-containing protein 18 [Poecile atricapillus]